MSRGNLFKFIAVILIIIAASVSFYKPLFNSLNLGLDLRGGVHVVLQAEDQEGKKVTKEDMAQLKSVMEQRVNELGVSEPLIQQEGENRLIIELPGVGNPDEAVNIIGKTASLKFQTEQHGVILTGKDLADAKAVIDPTTNKPVVQIKFEKEGAKKFAEVTSELAGWGQIAIILDDKIISNPNVNTAIPNGEAIIEGGFESYEEAVNLAALLRGGSLPVDVEIIDKRNIGPQLGSDSLNKSMVAIAVGVSALVIFIIIFYRLPGFLASLALLVYGLLLLALFKSIDAVLTLPGIAGLLLSVGMAVDANIIIFERIKEELRNEKSLRASVDAGFKRALWTILDANITTLIVTAVLYYFGTGVVKGFAVTLSLGILVSMFTAIVLSRWLLKLVVRIRAFNNLKLFGI